MKRSELKRRTGLKPGSKPLTTRKPLTRSRKAINRVSAKRKV